MKQLTALLTLVSFLALAPSASADDVSPSVPEVVCLDTLDVRESLPILHEIAPRARVHADRQSNCFVVIALPHRLEQITRVLARLEERARARLALRERSARERARKVS